MIKKSRKIAAVITAITGDRVVVGELELLHAVEEHFEFIPREVVLEILERVLRDPVAVFEEEAAHLFHVFYKVDRNKYLVVIVKRAATGNFFASMYPTGSQMRAKHKKLRRVR